MSDKPRVHFVGHTTESDADELAYLRGEVAELRSQRMHLGDTIAELHQQIKVLRSEDRRRMNRDHWVKDLLRRIASLEQRCRDLMWMNGRLMRTLTADEKKELRLHGQ